MPNKLVYRLKALFIGEHGIVERVESVQEKDEKGRKIKRDNFGKLPQLVTFKNPLGELVKKYSRKEYRYNQRDESIFYYRTYKPGDKFP